MLKFGRTFIIRLKMKLKSVKEILYREVKYTAFFETSGLRSFFYEVIDISDLYDILTEDVDEKTQIGKC